MSTAAEVGEFAGRVERLRSSARLERAKALGPRYALIGACAVLSLVGMNQLLFGEPARVTSSGAGRTRDASMESFATGFVRSCLSYDATAPGRREAALRGYLPDYLDEDGGFTPQSGSQQVLWAEVAQNQEALGGGRIITVAAQTDRSPTPVYVAVPVKRVRGSGLVLADYPALVGPPRVAVGIEQPVREDVEDPQLTEMVTRVVSNYLAGNERDLGADLGRKAKVTLPSVPLAFTSLDRLVWADGPDSGAVETTVQASQAGVGTYSLTYEIGVLQSGGRWYARWIDVVSTAG